MNIAGRLRRRFHAGRGDVRFEVRHRPASGTLHGSRHRADFGECPLLGDQPAFLPGAGLSRRHVRRRQR
jgi:hypothetical protein